MGEDDPSSCMKEGKRGVESALQEGLVPFDATEGTHTRRSSASGSSPPLLQPDLLGANTTDRVRSDQRSAQRVRETKKRDRSNPPLSPAAQPRLPLPNTSGKQLKRELPGRGFRHRRRKGRIEARLDRRRKLETRRRKDK